MIGHSLAKSVDIKVGHAHFEILSNGQGSERGGEGGVERVEAGIGATLGDREGLPFPRALGGCDACGVKGPNVGWAIGICWNGHVCNVYVGHVRIVDVGHLETPEGFVIVDDNDRCECLGVGVLVGGESVGAVTLGDVKGHHRECDRCISSSKGASLLPACLIGACLNPAWGHIFYAFRLSALY